MPLTRIFLGESSKAADRVKASRAAFEQQYIELLGDYF